MRQIRILVILIIALAAVPLLAAPQIAVYRNWDNVQVTNLEIVDYGDTEAGTPISRLFRIENHGNTTLNVSVSLDTREGRSYGWSIITQPSPTVAPMGSTTFRVRLLSNDDGRWFGYVNINSNDPAMPLFRFTTQGYVHGPRSAVHQVGTFYAPDSTYDFGTIPAGTVVTRSFTISNSGTRNLSISNASSLVSGAGFVQVGVPVSVITQGGSTSFSVRFAPTAPNTVWNGQIAIYTNDVNRSPYVIFLTGRTN